MRPAEAEAIDALRSQAITKYDRDFYAFTEEILGYQDMYEPLHRRMCDWLVKWEPGKYIKLLLVAREHLKSTLGAISYPIYEFYKQPHGFRVMLAHGKFQTGVGYLREAKAKMRKPMLHFLAPDKFWRNPRSDAEVWQEGQIVLPGNEWKVPSFLVSSLDSDAVGTHFNLIIGDDLVNRQNCKTKDLRQNVKEYFHSFIPMLLPEGRILVIGTFWSHDDLYSYLLDKENPYHVHVDSFIQGCGYPGEPVFPRVNGKTGFTLEDLEARKGGMDEYSWSCQYLLDPTPRKLQYFHRADIRPFDLSPDGRVPTSEPVSYFTAIDPNRSLKTMNDPGVVLTCGLDADGHYWIVDITKGHPSGPELVDWIRGHVIRWSPVRVICEAVGFQLQLAEWCKQDMVKNGVYYNIHAAERGVTQKIERITRMQIMVREGRLHVRRGLESIVDELEFYPKWKHDDQADALADIFEFGKAPPPKPKVNMWAPTNPFVIQDFVDYELKQRGGVQRVQQGGVRRSR